MAIITLKCPQCGGEIQLDTSNDFGFCMYCGSKLQITQKVKVEHSGSVSIAGMENIDSLLKKGFMNLESGNFNRAEDDFQKVLSIDANNIFAMIGLMLNTNSHRNLYYYNKIKSISTSICNQETQVLNEHTCRLFAETYARAYDYDRLDYVIQKYPECIYIPRRILNVSSKYVSLSLDKAKLLIKYGSSPTTIFNEHIKYLDLDALEFLIQEGLEINPKIDSSTEFTTNKEKYLRDYNNSAWSLYPLGKTLILNRLDLAECLLKHGANNGTIFVRLTYLDEPDKVVSWSYFSYTKNKGTDSARNLLWKYGIREKEGACYVATCVYGSYDCPQVWTLRRYRDTTLSSTAYGRTFIKLYYATSPSLVKCLGHTKWFKKINRFILNIIVNQLQKKGYSSAPYQDKP